MSAELPRFVTLAELNAWAASRDSATCTARYAVGKAGSTRRGLTGAHGHVIRILTLKEHGTPDFKHAVPACNQNSGVVGIIIDGADTDAVRCSKCVAWLERSTKNIRSSEQDTTPDTAPR